MARGLPHRCRGSSHARARSRQRHTDAGPLGDVGRPHPAQIREARSKAWSGPAYPDVEDRPATSGALWKPWRSRSWTRPRMLDTASSLAESLRDRLCRLWSARLLAVHALVHRAHERDLEPANCGEFQANLSAAIAVRCAPPHNDVNPAEVMSLGPTARFGGPFLFESVAASSGTTGWSREWCARRCCGLSRRGWQLASTAAPDDTRIRPQQRRARFDQPRLMSPVGLGVAWHSVL